MKTLWFVLSLFVYSYQFPPKRVEKGVYPFVVFFNRRSQPMFQGRDIWNLYPLVGTIINEWYVITQASYMVAARGITDETWVIGGAGAHNVSAFADDPDEVRTYLVGKFFIHPKYKYKPDYDLDPTNLALAKTTEAMVVPEAIISWKVFYAEDTTFYPHQKFDIMSIVYWKLDDNGRRLEKWLIEYIPERNQPKGHKGKYGCPRATMSKADYCLSTTTGITDHYNGPCKQGTISRGAPLLINNEFHGMFIGMMLKYCKMRTLSQEEQQILKTAPVYAIGVVNIESNSNDLADFKGAANFLRDTIGTKHEYNNFALWGSGFPPMNFSEPNSPTSEKEVIWTKRPKPFLGRKLFPYCILDGSPRSSSHGYIIVIAAFLVTFFV